MDSLRQNRASRFDPREQVCAPRDILPSDLENVFESIGCYETDIRALTFQNKVGGNSRAMENLSEFRRLKRRLLDGGFDPVHESNGRIARCRWCFGGPNLPGFPVEQGDIGKGAASVDCDGVSYFRFGFDGGVHSRISVYSPRWNRPSTGGRSWRRAAVAAASTDSPSEDRTTP